jgi:post-segregation antitoxin (ccd killing protein)
MEDRTEILKTDGNKSKRPGSRDAKTNITLKLDKDLIRRVRVLAAEKGTSVSALLSAKLEEELSQRNRYEEAKKHALAVLAEGWDLGGAPPTREQMHER